MYNNFYGQNYNPYQPQGYMQNYRQPNYAQQPQPQQMAQQQAQQPMQYETPIQYVGYATLKEAEAYILMPSAKAVFIDRTNGMVYEKVCGQDGQSYITHFKKVEDKSEPKKEEQPIDLSNFVKKEDLGGFVSVKQYNDLLARFEQLQKQVVGVKQNVGSKQQ